MSDRDNMLSNVSDSMAVLLQGYRAAPGAFDELLNEAGMVRSPQSNLFEALASLPPEELRRRAETCRRLVHEQGITYNVYGDPRGMERQWLLDPIPLVVGSEEWRGIETALVQRATLLNRILADCYGGQELIRSGWLPPALVFAQPDFLRPCHGISPINGVFLHFYAVDLARSPDGQWWVVSDRTQIPTGAGYALANRLVTSRLLPEPFQEYPVRRLAGFFNELRASLAAMAARRTDNPRVVLLTPGPFNETYFEQAYLARYLGYTLVEGSDLTVRDDRVCLKTLAGLEPVDVILRRVDDDFCDPLELRNDSLLGIPGLLEVLRAGNVAISNLLGSGLVQSPALMGFLPGLSRHLLGEELLMPSVATWWGGQREAEEYLRAHFDELLVRRAFREAGNQEDARDGDACDVAVERETLRQQFRSHPHLFVGQERVEMSSAPSWNGKDIVARSVMMRVYLVSTGSSYSVMPGGLTRVTTDADATHVSMQHGGESKDTWVLAEGAAEDFSLLQRRNQPLELRRVGNNLPSRVADNLYWLGRYAERSEGMARLLRSALLRFSPESTGHATTVWAPLFQALEAQSQLAPSTAHPELRQNAEALEAELLAAIFDGAQPGSLRNLAGRLEKLAILVRDRMSTDVWRVLSQLDERLALPVSGGTMLAGDAVGVLNQVLIHLASFRGFAMENMTRGQGWRFLDIGHRLERAASLAILLDCALQAEEANNPSLLEAVLEVADSSITYRSRYNLVARIVPVYDLILLDQTNPRSLIFQLNQLSEHIEELPLEQRSPLPTPAQRILLDCISRVRLADPLELDRMDRNWTESGVGRIVQWVRGEMPRLSDAIAVNYFAHSTISRAGQGSSDVPRNGGDSIL